MAEELFQRYRLLHGESEAARAELARIKASGKPAVLVSACLVGVRCRFDGNDKKMLDVVARHTEGAEIVPLCPEVLARLGVPRPPMTLSADGKQATTDKGRDVTKELDQGARLADMLAEQAGVVRALLKERSPSCGVTKVHGPAGVQDGEGRLTARLKRRNLPIVSEES